MPDFGSPRVRIITDLGDIVAQLYPDRAPISVAAFLTEVDAGHYDGSAFGRIVRADNDRGTPVIEMIQAACPAKIEQRADVAHESTVATGLRHEDGTLSLPRADGSDSCAQSFFVCIGAQPALDQGGGRGDDGLGFAAFGRIVAGLDVASAIHAVPTSDEAPVDHVRGQLPVEPVAIHRIARESDDADAQLCALADDYWRFRLREYPIDAFLGGFGAGDGLLGEATDVAEARRARACTAMLLRARAIHAEALGAEAGTTLALLSQQLEAIIAAHALDEHYRPRLFPFGFTSLPSIFLQQANVDTLAAREAVLARVEAMPAYLRDNLGLLRDGFARGYRLQRAVVPSLLTMLDGDLGKQGFAAQLIARFSVDIAGAEAEALAAQRTRAAALANDGVTPAIAEVRAYIAGLQAELTDEPGLAAQPEGRDYYRFKVRQQTSTELDPDAIHAIGLDEVGRIHGEIDRVLAEMGRSGERAAVAAELEAKVAPDADSLLSLVRAYAKRIDGLLPRIIGTMPRISYGVEPMTAAASAAMPPALAQPAPADRSMPGIYWLTALPEKLPLHLIPALTLHEAWPGHLMQFSLAHELADLPDFRRYGWTDYNGYVEGWALYCERLGHDLGLYDDPADRFGLLSFEVWRAARLVVDTGLHWLGWSRSRAIDYLSTNSFLPHAVCVSEVDRYIGMPAQALSYKLGERVIATLRLEAETELGEFFSLRDFHGALLCLGPVSLTELQTRIRAWYKHAASLTELRQGSLT